MQPHEHLCLTPAVDGTEQLEYVQLLGVLFQANLRWIIIFCLVLTKVSFMVVATPARACLQTNLLLLHIFLTVSRIYSLALPACLRRLMCYFGRRLVQFSYLQNNLKVILQQADSDTFHNTCMCKFRHCLHCLSLRSSDNLSF